MDDHEEIEWGKLEQTQTGQWKVRIAGLPARLVPKVWGHPVAKDSLWFPPPDTGQAWVTMNADEVVAHGPERCLKWLQEDIILERMPLMPAYIEIAMMEALAQPDPYDTEEYSGDNGDDDDLNPWGRLDFVS